MCELMSSAVAAIGSMFGGTTAAGSTAAAATAGAATAGAGTLSTIGTLLSAGGALYQGYSSYRAGKEQAALLSQQAATQAQLNTVQDARTRRQYVSQMRQQQAELAARGVTLDSPTAVALGQSAAQEMSFASQAIRSEGAAQQIELSYARRASRARAVSSLLQGGLSAAGSLLTRSPDVWPSLRGSA